MIKDRLHVAERSMGCRPITQNNAPEVEKDLCLIEPGDTHVYGGIPLCNR